MSGAEAALVLGLVSSALAIFEAAYQVYSAAHDAKGLTKSIRAPAEQVPLVLHTLGLVERGLTKNSTPPDAVKSIRPILERCRENACLIKDIFEKVVPSKDATRAERYRKAVEAKLKGAEIKSNMKAVMQDLALLEKHQIFRDAETIEDIKLAIEGLSRRGSEERSTSVTRAVSGGLYSNTGFATQENNMFTNSGSGDFYNAKIMTINKVENIIQQSNSESYGARGPKTGSCLLPRSVSRYFVGREDVLARLKAALPCITQEQQKQTRIAITGIGGLGKSEICLRLAEEIRHRFAHIIWVDVSNSTAAEHKFVAIARRSGRRVETLEEAVQEIGSIAQRWLLVLDNADDMRLDYAQFFPPGSQGTVMITSRNQECGRAYGWDHWEELLPLDQSNATALLLRCAGAADQPKNRTSAETVVDTLGYHTLAITLAGACIARGYCSLHEYVGVYEAQWRRMVSYSTPQDRSRYGSVLATFEASLAALESEAPESRSDALDLLQLLAAIAFKGVTMSFFADVMYGIGEVEQAQGPSDVNFLSTWHIDNIPAFLKSAHEEGDTRRIDHTCMLLQTLSLANIAVDGNDRTVSLHPLVHEWIWRRQDISRMEKSWEMAASTSSLALYGARQKDSKFEQRLHVHALVTARRRWKLLRQPRLPHLQILFQCAAALDDFRDDRLALRILDEIVDQLRVPLDGLEPEHLCLFRLWARSALRGGDAVFGAEILENVVRVEAAVIGERDPGHLESQHALAGAYEANGRIEEAVDLLEHVLQIREADLEEGHVSLLASQHELARLFTANGQVKRAISMLAKVVQVRDSHLPERHQDRLASQHALAGAYEADGQAEKAIGLLEHVVEVRKLSLPDGHPDLMASQHELARAYESNDQLEDAIQLLEHVVQLEVSLADDHPDRLASQHVLAGMYKAAGRIDEAIAIFERVVKGYAKLVEDHPNRLAAQRGLAESLEARKKA